MALLLLLGLGVAFAEVVKPEGCPDDRWTEPCSGSATCQSLAAAGFICGDQAGGVGVIPGCNTKCESPCCITTTTTTMTSTSITTVTGTTTGTSTVTTTVTTTGTTATITMTGTSTVTITGTSTETSTFTRTTTSTFTMTTETVTTLPVTEVTTAVAEETTAEKTTAEPSEGPSRRLTIRIKITDVNDSFEYVTDSRVSTAYRETIMKITGLRKEAVDLQMVVNEPGSITVSYILSVPDNADGEASMKAVEESLTKETASSFNGKLQQEIDTLVGPGVYTQKVLSMESEGDDGTIAVGGSPPHGSALQLSFVAFMIAATL